MARITRQFLTRKYRYREYAMDDVSLDVSFMSKDAAEGGSSVWVDLVAGYGRRQALALSRDDVRQLASALLRCLETDREFHAVLQTYFEKGRRKRPVVG